MRATRLTIAEAGGAAAAADRVRALAPGGASVATHVAAIVADVRERGDVALQEYVERFDAVGGASLRVTEDELAAAAAALDPAVADGLRVAIENVRAVAAAGVSGDVEVPLAQGQTVTIRELPVSRAAIYVPGGRAPYPSTVVMGVVTAQAAGVRDVVVCAPGSHPVILAACALCGATEVWRMGGAHAVAALAYGTAQVARADVIAGPGNLWVQEAKRQVSGDVGIDGFLGPSDVLVLAGPDADPRLVAADLLAQAEHGDGSISCCVSPDAAVLDAVASLVEDAPETGAALALVHSVSAEDALALAEAFAPEHLELTGALMEALVPQVTRSGCVFVGGAGGTAFGDYVAGSNHSLPTGGTARFASALGPKAFRRRMSVVRIGDAAGALADAGAAIARAEGFEQHARSMELRKNLDG